MSWLTPCILTKSSVSEEDALDLLDHIGPSFSDAEKKVAQDAIHTVFFGSGENKTCGKYYPNEQIVTINTTHPTMSRISAIPDEFQIAHTLAHEITHPLLQLAAQAGPGRYLVFPAALTDKVQNKVRNSFPKAAELAETHLNSAHLSQTDWSVLSTEERLAADVYMNVDERFYDIFGPAYSKDGFRGAYNHFDREHEIGCNLRALQAIEPMMTGQEPYLVEQLAGDILDKIAVLFDKALRQREISPEGHHAEPVARR